MAAGLAAQPLPGAAPPSPTLPARGRGCRTRQAGPDGERFTGLTAAPPFPALPGVAAISPSPLRGGLGRGQPRLRAGLGRAGHRPGRSAAHLNFPWSTWPPLRPSLQGGAGPHSRDLLARGPVGLTGAPFSPSFPERCRQIPLPARGRGRRTRLAGPDGEGFTGLTAPPPVPSLARRCSQFPPPPCGEGWGGGDRASLPLRPLLSLA